MISVHVHVVVRNRGAGPAFNTQVHLYWADPATNIPFAHWQTDGIRVGTEETNVQVVPELGRETPESDAARNELGSLVAQKLDAFEQSLTNEREQVIWRERLRAVDPRSLSSLGKEFGVSKERIRQVEARITEGLRGRYLINPRVNVSIVEYRPFYVRGEVSSPGGFPFKPGLTVEKAVSMAGGFTPRASKSKFYIVSDDSLEGEGEVRRAATLTSRIRPGDVINIEQSFF